MIPIGPDQPPRSGWRYFSDRVQSIPEALSIYFNQLANDLKRKDRNITTLSLGEAFFDIPLFDFAALDKHKIHHYSDSRGLPELRASIADYYQQRYGAPIDPDQELLITAGSKMAIFLALQAILNHGDEVVIHEPAWLSYQEHARLLNASPRFIPYDAPIDRFQRCFGSRTRVLIINNPNNPAGRLYSRRELETLYAQCRDRSVYMLVDEAYSDFVSGTAFSSMASIVPDKEGAIIVNSLSKNLGMSGWRIGYMVGNADLISQSLKLNQHLITCAPTILQHYVAAYLGRILASTLPQIDALIAKRQRIDNCISRLHLRALPGSATFYFFLSIENFPGTSFDLAMDLLLNHDIAVVPGSAYGASTERFIRVGIGTEPEERIAAALETIANRLAGPPASQERMDEQLKQWGLPRFARQATETPIAGTSDIRIAETAQTQ